ncbi:MAG: hypothetical protein NTX88_05475, partial [Candidatus Atribacteria bacterium]|nr:hypothetical protein [Candidatus Atribacteria bacterium]
MNSRERFKAVMRGERVALPLWEYAYWVDTIRNWYQCGLPNVYGLPETLSGGSMVYGESLYWPDEASAGPRDRDVHAYFGLDEGYIRVPVKSWIWPPFEIQTISDESDRLILRDQMGVVREVMKDGKSVPRFLQSPVRNREDFDIMKSRLDPSTEGRFPENWDTMAQGFNEAQFPVVFGGHPCGFFGSLRYLIGLENLCYTYYDNPSLIHEVNNHLCNLWVNVWGKALSEVKVDCVHMWEDMSYVGGSLISPAAFREFMMPYYKRVVNTIKDCGVEFIWVDTDGDCRELIPLFVECGITGMYPFEA